MAAMIYDAAAGAWKETATPLVWDAEMQAYKDSTGLVWDEQAQAWTERWSAVPKELIVGRDILLSQGTFKNCTPEYFDGDNGAAGFAISGNASTPYDARYGYCDMSHWLRWDLSYDFTHISRIKWSGCKDTHTSNMYGKITDGLYYSPNTYSPATTEYVNSGKFYTYSESGIWYNFEMDTSRIDGTHIFSLVGGYTDGSGGSSPKTLFKNIIFEQV